MPLQSKTTVKVTGIPAETTREETFAIQNGIPVGTVSFASSKSKDDAIRRHKKNTKSPWKGWILKDTFDFLTVIYDYGDEAEVE
jgi:hypothetical protein